MQRRLLLSRGPKRMVAMLSLKRERLLLMCMHVLVPYMPNYAIRLGGGLNGGSQWNLVISLVHLSADLLVILLLFNRLLSASIACSH